MRRLLLALVLTSTAARAELPRRFGMMGVEPDLAELPRDARRALAGGDQSSRRFRMDVQPQLAAPFRPWLAGSSVAVAPDGAVFVADTENDAVAISSADGKTLVRTIALGAGAAPEQVVVGPDGRAYVSLRGAGRVAAIAANSTDPTVADLAAPAFTQVGAEPFGLALSADGRTLFVSLARAGEVVALDAASLTEKSRLRVDPEPRGLAASPEGDKLFVAHLTGRALSVVELPAQTVKRIPLPGATRERLAELAGEPQRLPNLTFAIALSPSGRRVFVPHALEDTGSQVAPEARSGGYGAGTFQPVMTTLTSIDADAGEPTGNARGSQRARMGFALNRLSQPRAIVVDPVRTRLFVAGLGSDDVRVLNSAYVDPILGPAEDTFFAGSGAGPKGLAISRDGNRLYVHASLQHRLIVVDVGRTRRATALARLTVGPETLPPAAVHGRALFYTARDPHISLAGQFACATCHPEGRQDGMVWRLDQGPRQTPILAGRLVGTAPYNWLGTRGTLQANMKDTMGRLGGRGIKQRDLEDLELYLTKYLDPGPATPPAHSPALVERGRALFESDDVGCAHCHNPDANFTDGKNHDIGTTTGEEVAHLKIARGEPVEAEHADPRAIAGAAIGYGATTGFLRMLLGRAPLDEEQLGQAASVAVGMLRPELPQANLLMSEASRAFAQRGIFARRPMTMFSSFAGLIVSPPPKKPKKPLPLRLAYNTPSLVGVSRSAPYFHDGSAPSLRDVVAHNPGDRMGRTSQLAGPDVDALVAYLETL